MSVFNPYVLIGIVLSIVSAFGGGYYKGSRDETTRQQLEIAKLNAEARQKEQVLVSLVTSTATQLSKANQNARLTQQKRNADIDSGTLKLRIPVKAPDCSIPVSPDTSSSARVGPTTPATAELDGKTAKALIAITDEGDEAIRKLNACLDLYNQTIETMKGKQP
jgi:prophage endopeptidase